MARIEEKVKDIVEVRPHATAANFEGDSPKAVAAYHFTDITADLMAKWLARVVELTPQSAGAAIALAGFRGVGKSHLLAAFGGLLKQPDLRGRVDQPHVEKALAGLQRKALSVAFVRRGARPTLREEIWDALTAIFPEGISTKGGTTSDLLVGALEKADAGPLVILIDTAFARTTRVSRDDGPELAELAVFSRTNALFVAIALDDDIAGADGANSAISKTFKIDYLDQEHLYNIVDTHIFPKHQRMLPVLHGIYEQYRAVVPAFRWSASRFTSLYPLHPAIMELAPFVRLYLPDFALLRFASEAGARITGRPADSLIAPDEVFDNVEKSLREVPALEESFAAFDRVNDAVVSKTPVMKRLQAKLILKGLFLFSLNDEGVTAAEIGSSMLIYDEKDPKAAVAEIDAVLQSFAAAVPDAVKTIKDQCGGLRYVFQLAAKNDLKTAVAVAAQSISKTQVTDMLMTLMNERFSDCDFESVTSESSGRIECTAEWRGGKRRGRFIWNPSTEAVAVDAGTKRLEWEIRVAVGDNRADAPPASELPPAIWNPAELTEVELEVVRGLWVLHNDAVFRAEFSEHIAAAVQTQTVAAEKIFQRAFLDESTFTVDGFDYNLTEEARGADTLRQLGTVMLDSLFGARYSLHPVLERPLEMSAVSSLTADFFSGARPDQEDTQRNAGDFAVPLGLADQTDAGIFPLSAETLLETDFALLVLDAVKAGEGTAPLDNIFARLAATPYGLTRESAFLVLGALAGQQLIDFVTTSGDRISRHSLDLKLIWDDLVAVARPQEANFSGERLASWARLLTGDESIKSLADSQPVRDSLVGWLAEWKRRSVATRFELLQDDEITARVWRLANVAIRPFTAAADSISRMTADGRTIEEVLRSIAEEFSDSVREFERRADELASVESFTAGAAMRREAARYAALCPFADNEEVDELHTRLLGSIDASWAATDAAAADELATTWENFRRSYIDLYLVRHGRLAIESRERLAEILDTDIWWDFENLSELPAFNPDFRIRARRLINEIGQPDCPADVEALLKTDPVCVCGFTFASLVTRERLPGELWNLVNSALVEYCDVLTSRVGEIQAFASESVDKALSSAARKLGESLMSGDVSEQLSSLQIAAIRRVFAPRADGPDSKVEGTAHRRTEFNHETINASELLESAELVLTQ